ncbi:MAG: flagellin, partial [Caldicoprobacterales bacterium]
GSKAMEKLSSGLRINRAADDAAGLSISEKMRGQIRGLSQAARNTQDGISFIQTAEGALNEVSAMLVRMKELAVQKANGTLSEQDTGNIDQELKQLSDEILGIVEGSEFNGKNLFEQINIVTTDNDTDVFKIGINAEDDLDLAGIEIADPEEDGVLEVSVETKDIEDAINTVNTARATLGAQQNRLEHIYNNINTTTENLQAAEARIRDTDMAQEMMEFTKNNILQQAAQAMLAQANQVPQGVLQLLR